MNRRERRAAQKPRAEWRKRHDFAEFAEALNVSTNAIMAVHAPQSDSVLVLYSPDVEQDETKIFRATLRRSVDGTLFVVDRYELPGFWQQLVRQMEND